MAFDKLGRFFGISEDDEMNEVPYTESEEQQEEIPQTQKMREEQMLFLLILVLVLRVKSFYTNLVYILMQKK